MAGDVGFLVNMLIKPFLALWNSKPSLWNNWLVCIEVVYIHPGNKWNTASDTMTYPYCAMLARLPFLRYEGKKNSGETLMEGFSLKYRKNPIIRSSTHPPKVSPPNLGCNIANPPPPPSSSPNNLVTITKNRYSSNYKPLFIELLCISCRFSMLRDLWCSINDCRTSFVFHFGMFREFNFTMQYSCLHLKFYRKKRTLPNISLDIFQAQ